MNLKRHLFANWILPRQLQAIEVPSVDEFHHRFHKLLSLLLVSRHEAPLVALRIFKATDSNDYFHSVQTMSRYSTVKVCKMKRGLV